ncbi:MAG: TetR family transcriptional regulator [Acidimicrobiia bacterium]|nr:TetR family transcriptional regulator [Acidimicrobiia bacterium]
MTARVDQDAPRLPLSRERVLDAAVAFADEAGVEAVSMRRLGERLGVEAMSLYNHVKNKDDLLDGMIDTIVAEIEVPAGEEDWKAAMRSQILAAREVMKRHQWAPAVLETRVSMSQPMMRYMDDFCGTFIRGGFSIDLTHHALHALGSRMLGFNQELFNDSEALEESPEVQALMLNQMAGVYPNIHRLMVEITHQEDTIVGSGCDDDVEFTFSLDLILDGIERLKQAEEAS